MLFVAMPPTGLSPIACIKRQTFGRHPTPFAALILRPNPAAFYNVAIDIFTDIDCQFPGVIVANQGAGIAVDNNP